MLANVQRNFYLTGVASYDSVLPERYCPVCEHLQFKGYAQRIELKCRRCKTMLMFVGEQIIPTSVKVF